MIAIDSQRFVTIRGFEITVSERRVRTRADRDPGDAADHIRLAGNVVRDMGTTFEGRNGGTRMGSPCSAPPATTRSRRSRSWTTSSRTSGSSRRWS